jgi:hypothetical protein
VRITIDLPGLERFDTGVLIGESSGDDTFSCLVHGELLAPAIRIGLDENWV